MQLYAVNFIPLLGSLYMFVILYLTVWFEPVAVHTVEHCAPDDGRVWRPKHVE